MGLNFEPGEGTFVTHLTFKQMVPKIIPLAQKHRGLAGFAFANHDDKIYFITNWSVPKILGNLQGEMERFLNKIDFGEVLEDAVGLNPTTVLTCKMDEKTAFENIAKLKPSYWTRPLHTLLHEKLKDCEVSDELEEGEIQVFGDCNFKVAAMGKLTDEEKSTFMDQDFKEEKTLDALPAYAEMFLEYFGSMYTQDKTLRETMFAHFSKWYGQKVDEKDVSPQIREKLEDRYIHNTEVDKNGKRIPVPLCYECGRGRGEGKDYCSGKCRQAGVVWTCDTCGAQGVSQESFTDRHGRTCTFTKCKRCKRDFTFSFGGSGDIPQQGNKRKDPNHVPKWKKAKILPKIGKPER
jgi:hypothetical protein